MVKGIIVPRLSKRESDAFNKFLRDNPQANSHEVATLYSIIYSIINKRKAIIH
jgi:hypothetical protein